MDSDQEFWEDLASVQPLRKMQTQVTPSEVSEIQFLKQRLRKIQLAHAVELENVRVSTIAKIKVIFKQRKYQKQLDDVKEQFLQESKNMLRSYEDIKLILAKRERDLKNALNTLISQEELLSLVRSDQQEEQVYQKPKETIEPLDDDEREDYIKLKHQMELLRGVCGVYQDEVSRFKKEKEEVVNEFEQYKENIRDMQNKVVLEMQNSVDKWQRKYLKLKNKFQLYKFNINQELQISEQIKSRNQTAIRGLKQDLVYAKQILLTPHLKAKLQSRQGQRRRKSVQQQQVKQKTSQDYSLEDSYYPEQTQIIQCPTQYRRSFNRRPVLCTPSPRPYYV